jgi:ketosteroid isomerase-like protein
MSANVEAIRAIYAAFGRGDVSGIVALMTDGVRWHIHYPASVPVGGERVGREAVAAWFPAFGAAVEMTAFLPESFVDGGGQVVVLGRESGRVRATGRVWTTQWVHIWTFAGDKISGFDEFADSAAVAAAFAR